MPPGRRISVTRESAQDWRDLLLPKRNSNSSLRAARTMVEELICFVRDAVEEIENVQIVINDFRLRKSTVISSRHRSA